MAVQTGMPSDDWAQLIDTAGQSRHGKGGAERSPALAGPAVGTPCGTDLKHSGATWTRSAGVADALRAHLGQVRAEFAAAHDGLAAGTQGLAVAGVLQAVRGSWERRFDSVIDECGNLAEKLRAVARAQGAIEAEIGSSFARAGTPGGDGGGNR